MSFIIDSTSQPHPLPFSGAVPCSPLWTGRRGFLKQALTGAAAAALLSPWDLARRAFAASSFRSVDDASPLSHVTDGVKQTDFNGDDFSRPHDLLWDKANYLRSRGGIPAATERADVVVIGGGMAGLAAAHELRGLRPVVLESSPRFGGFSQGERWGGVDYSLGAAYITVPDEGSPVETLLRELGVWERGRRDDAEGGMAMVGSELKSGFWSGGTDPARAAEFERAWKELALVREEGFPDIPRLPESALSSEQLAELDRTPFSAWVKARLGGAGGTVHPHLSEFVHEYCWSSFSADPSELSAAQALNFLACDLGGTIALPGGNAAISAALYEKLRALNGPGSLRAGAMVLDVARVEDGVRICYEDSARNLRTILARACVMTCPKFVARFLVADLPREQAEAMQALKYRAYLVANVLVRGRSSAPAYDVFRLTGAVPTDPRAESNRRPFTDLVFANWAAEPAGNPGNTVLTLYKALPYDGARQFAYTPQFYARHRGMIEGALPSILGAVGLSADRVADVRMTRWGHALPVAGVGLYASGELARASATVGARIFFAGQDNYANPCFETAVGTAREAAVAVRGMLSGWV